MALLSLYRSQSAIKPLLFFFNCDFLSTNLNGKGLMYITAVANLKLFLFFFHLERANVTESGVVFIHYCCKYYLHF